MPQQLCFSSSSTSYFSGQDSQTLQYLARLEKMAEQTLDLPALHIGPQEAFCLCEYLDLADATKEYAVNRAVYQGCTHALAYFLLKAPTRQALSLAGKSWAAQTIFKLQQDEGISPCDFEAQEKKQHESPWDCAA